MTEKAFNLLEEPWILVLDQEGQTRQVSLLELFSQAHGLKALAGEIVAQDVALLRVFLAILYAVFGWQDLEGREGLPENDTQAISRWQALWDRGRFPMEMIEEYLRDWQEHFYLFHPQTPFFQVALGDDAVVEASGKKLPINPLTKNIKTLIGDLAESENKPQLFSYRSDNQSLDYAEAARWLIHLNSFDVSPLGAPPRGAFRAKGFKVPWPNTLGLVWAEGDNLFETLMLNFVLAPVGQDVWPDFKPDWEREIPFSPQELTQIEAPFPADPCALFTFPFRRLQLRRDDQARVTGCTLWGGHLVETDSGNFFAETMTLWKKDNEGRYAPKTHDPSRQMWRDFPALLSGAQSSPPGIVSWLSALQIKGGIRLPLLRLCIGGMVLSSKKTSIDDALSDSLRFQASLLADLEEGWPARISSELAVADKLVQQVGFLAANLIRATGGSGDKDPRAASAKAREQGYYLLDAPFRQWLEGLGPSENMDEACQSWRSLEGQLLRGYGQQLVERSGLKALVGRRVKEKAGDTAARLYTAPALYAQFLRQTNKILKE
ncbi:MAG: type I-E CRISPR-associated protein Cse1/CasA [Clostridiales bacterium]|nr:type I-E CRISPR-associated protein Cse1/CasA [Clostridiales bacterium]